MADDGSVQLSFGLPGRSSYLGELPAGEAARLLRAVRRALRHCERKVEPFGPSRWFPGPHEPLYLREPVSPALVPAQRVVLDFLRLKSVEAGEPHGD